MTGRPRSFRFSLSGNGPARAGIERAMPELITEDSQQADFFLATAGTLAVEPTNELGLDADRHRNAGKPRALWITTSAAVRAAQPRLLSAFDRIFVPHPHAADFLAPLTSKRPAVLAPASSPVAFEMPLDLEKARIGYFGGYSLSWSSQGRAMIDSYLHSAMPNGLRIILGSRDEIAELPARFANRAEVVEHDADRIKRLAEFAMIVAPVPTEECEVIPQEVMDALAAGTWVVMPSNILARMALPRVVGFVNPGEQPVERIKANLELALSGKLQADVLRRVARNTHTYHHRVATVAAALGFAALPAKLATIGEDAAGFGA